MLLPLHTYIHQQQVNGEKQICVTKVQFDCKYIRSTYLHSHEELNHRISVTETFDFFGRNVIFLHGHILSRRLHALKHDVVVR